MTRTEPLGELMKRIRHGQLAGMSIVLSPASNLRANVLSVLKDEGYIRDYARNEIIVGKPELKIHLKYFEGAPVIREIKRVSKPGRRVYSGIRDLPRICNGLGIAILSTPRGVMSDSQAREKNVGGEVLCSVL